MIIYSSQNEKIIDIQRLRILGQVLEDTSLLECIIHCTYDAALAAGKNDLAARSLAND